MLDRIADFARYVLGQAPMESHSATASTAANDAAALRGTASSPIVDTVTHQEIPHNQSLGSANPHVSPPLVAPPAVQRKPKASAQPTWTCSVYLQANMRCLTLMPEILKTAKRLAVRMNCPQALMALERAQVILDTGLELLLKDFAAVSERQQEAAVKQRCHGMHAQVSREVLAIKFFLIPDYFFCSLDAKVRTCWKWIELYALAKVLVTRPGWKTVATEALKVLRAQSIVSARGDSREQSTSSDTTPPAVQRLLNHPMVEKIFTDCPTHAYQHAVGEHSELEELLRIPESILRRGVEVTGFYTESMATVRVLVNSAIGEALQHEEGVGWEKSGTWGFLQEAWTLEKRCINALLKAAGDMSLMLKMDSELSLNDIVKQQVDKHRCFITPRQIYDMVTPAEISEALAQTLRGLSLQQQKSPDVGRLQALVKVVEQIQIEASANDSLSNYISVLLRRDSQTRLVQIRNDHRALCERLKKMPVEKSKPSSSAKKKKAAKPSAEPRATAPLPAESSASTLRTRPLASSSAASEQAPCRQSAMPLSPAAVVCTNPPPARRHTPAPAPSLATRASTQVAAPRWHPSKKQSSVSVAATAAWGHTVPLVVPGRGATRLYTSLRVPEALACIDRLADAATFGSPMASAEHHCPKHRLRRQPVESYYHEALEKTGLWYGEVERRYSDPSKLLYKVDTPDVWLLFSPGDNPTIVSYRNRAAHGAMAQGSS